MSDSTMTVSDAERRVLDAALNLHHARVASRLAFSQASATGSDFHRRELAAARDAKAAAITELDEAITILGEAEEAADVPPFLANRLTRRRAPRPS